MFGTSIEVDDCEDDGPQALLHAGHRERESAWAQHRRADRIVLYRMLLEILRSPCAGFRLRGQGLWNEFCVKQWRAHAIVYVYDEADAHVEVFFAGRFGTPTDPVRRLREYFASIGRPDSDHGRARLERLPCCRISDAERG